MIQAGSGGKSILAERYELIPVEEYFRECLENVLLGIAPEIAVWSLISCVDRIPLSV
jgi:hypothetical protein